MFSNPSGISSALRSFQIEERMLAYSDFIPKLYNWCIGLGFMPGKIMPSRAFCSDENQGMPIILLAKHFGVFPFNHGRVGGIVSVERHGPHAEHGKDLMLLQASHVGYDPETHRFGMYRRLHTEHENDSCDCGKIGKILSLYQDEYAYAKENVRLGRYFGHAAVLVDNLLLDNERRQGLFLNLERLVRHDKDGKFATLNSLSTAYVLPASEELMKRIGEDAWPREGSAELGKNLLPEDFFYKRIFSDNDTFHDQLERNLLAPMPWIVYAKHPLLAAACINTQAEFDRTYRSLAQDPAMRDKNMLFVSGINIDISPTNGEDFALTHFVPWAAYLQLANGSRRILEQNELLATLSSMSAENPAQIHFNEAIMAMSDKDKVRIQL